MVSSVRFGLHNVFRFSSASSLGSRLVPPLDRYVFASVSLCALFVPLLATSFRWFSCALSASLVLSLVGLSCPSFLSRLFPARVVTRHRFRFVVVWVLSSWGRTPGCQVCGPPSPVSGTHKGVQAPVGSIRGIYPVPRSFVEWSITLITFWVPLGIHLLEALRVHTVRY